jgi:hypothetical protein
MHTNTVWLGLPYKKQKYNIEPQPPTPELDALLHTLAAARRLAMVDGETRA